MNRRKPDHLSGLNDLRISAHFLLSEFECKGKLCCGYTVKVDPVLVTVLEMIRSRINQGFETSHHALVVTSGFRCPRHNKEVGGVHHTLDPLDPANSPHTHGLAADIACRTIPKRQLALICRDLAENGPIPFRVGFYHNGLAEVLHIDLLTVEPQIFGGGWDA